jgi:hypothetical protein
MDALFPSERQSTGEENTATTDADKIYDKDGIEIYKGDDKHKCISYNPSDPKTKLKKYSHCVAQPIGSNMYDNYRFKDITPTFYFLFDRNKPSTGIKPRFDDKWHVLVIQVLINEQGYIVTNANNDGDKFAKTWEDISNIVPADTWDKIKGLKDYFKPIKLSPEERGRKLNTGKNLNVDEFKELSQDEKELYVQGKGSEDKLTDDILNILPNYKINYGGITKTLANLAIDSGQKYKYSQLKDNEALAKRYAIFRFRHTNYGNTPIPLPFIKYLDEPAKEKYLETFDAYLTYEYIEKYFGPKVTEKYVNNQLEKLEYLPPSAIKYVNDPKKRQLLEAYSKLFSKWELDSDTNISDEQLENLKTAPEQKITPKPITEKEWKGMPDNDRSNIIKVAKQINGKEQYLTLLYALPYVIQDKTNSYVLLPKTSDTNGNWVLADIKGNVVKDNISGNDSVLDGEPLDFNNGYMNMDSFKRIYNISDLKIKSSNNVSEEFRRLQQLAGIITEMPVISNPVSKKIYGIEKNYSPYDFGPFTEDEAKAKAIEYANEDPGNTYQPRLYNAMRDELPAIERMDMPRIDKNGNLEDVNNTPFSQGDLDDY